MLHISSQSRQPSRSRFLCFALLCVFLLSSLQSLRAQGGPPNGPPYGPPAGSWGSPTTSNSGSWNYDSVYQGQSTNASKSWDTWYDQFMWVASDSGSSSHVDSTGTYTETRVWSGTGTPPATMSILESSHAIGSGGIYGSVPGSGTAWDAFSDPPVSVLGGESSTGSKLIQVDSSSGTITLMGTISASGDTPALTNGQAQGYSGVDSAFSWDFDPRTVSITSSDIETSYFKGIICPKYPTGQWPEVRDPTGSAYTDSAVSPPLTQPGGGTSWTADPTLMGQAANFQNPTFLWSLPGDGQGSLSASGNTAHTQLSVQFPLSTTDTALNKQSTVQLKVTDSDGASGTNTFTIRWHYPKENAKLYASGTPFWQPADLKRITAVGLIHGSAIGVFGYSTYSDFFPTASSDIFVVGSSLPRSPWAAFVAAVGLLASQVQPTETSYPCDFDKAWNSPHSTGLPTPNDPALMNQYQMDPIVVVQYQEQQWQYDQYGQKGYLGPSIECYNQFLGNAETAGAFTKLGVPPSGS